MLLLKLFRNYWAFLSYQILGFGPKIPGSHIMCVWYLLSAFCYPLVINPYSIVSKYLKWVIARPLLQSLFLTWSNVEGPYKGEREAVWLLHSLISHSVGGMLYSVGVLRNSCFFPWLHGEGNKILGVSHLCVWKDTGQSVYSTQE